MEGHERCYHTFFSAFGGRYVILESVEATYDPRDRPSQASRPRPPGTRSVHARDALRHSTEDPGPTRGTPAAHASSGSPLMLHGSSGEAGA